MVALACLLGKRGVREASFRLKLEAQSLSQETCETAHVGWDFHAESMEIEGFVGEPLTHHDTAEFALVAEFVVEEQEMGVGILSWLHAVQYKYTTYSVAVPDVPDDAVEVGVG